MQELTEAIKDGLRAKYPSATFEVLVKKLPDGEEQRYVVKLPISGPLWDMVQEKAVSREASDRAAANRMLFNGAVVWPEGDDMKALVKAWPAIPDAVGGDITELAGVTAEAHREKF